MNAAVFLDRDNTLIHNDGDLGDPSQVRLIQGVATAVASLCGLGYKIVVVTNQGGVARGKYSEDDVQAVNEKISQLIAAGANGAKIDRYYYCPYHPNGTVARYRKEHPNRKPAPGMLMEAAKDMGLDLSQSWTIGDQVRDIQAGLAAGTRAILLRQDADRLKPFDPREHPGLTDESGEQETATPDFYARNLVEAVRIVAQQRKPETSEQIHRVGPGQRKWDAAAVAKLQREKQAVGAENVAASRAAQSTADMPTSSTRKETRPFRPWNAPTAELDEDENEPESPQNEAAAAEVRSQTIRPPAVKPAADTAEAPAQASDEKTLRLILQELRNQRGADAEFSYTRIMAIVLQTVGFACLLGAFWLGAGDSALFIKLIGAAVFAQLAVITALLWDR